VLVAGVFVVAPGAVIVVLREAVVVPLDEHPHHSQHGGAGFSGRRRSLKLLDALFCFHKTSS
jgi:hypothetical protein